MKNLFFAIALILSISISAQEGTEKANVFVRVYDLQGKKISKGKIVSVTDSLLQLRRNGKTVKILMNSIGSIKTKRSAGNNLLIGAVTGATAGAIYGVADSDRDGMFTAAESAGILAIMGVVAGTAIGGFTILFKNSKSYEINGDMEKWKAFKEMIIK